MTQQKEEHGYNHKSIEEKWQKIWDETDAFQALLDRAKPKKYVLEMLPYPSGRIHVGHLRNYTIGDVLARMYRSMGFNVLHPMGWDAFGLPAENAAFQHKIAPNVWTMENIKSMRKQLKRLGFSYDWSREIATCSVDYYKHEQRFFLDFYKHGLIYRKEEVVNWDPVDQTVLANEQVVDGKGWRSGAIVERKKLRQWFLKISDFADELIADLGKLEGWPEKVKLMQERWIGKSEGAEVTFPIANSSATIDIYTTRPETLFGASFIGLSFEHPLLQQIEQPQELQSFLQECSQIGTAEDAIAKIEKKGYDTGLVALHPLDNTILLPVFVTNFVLPEYGSGAIFGCPAHDVRDHEFALKYNLPLKQVIKQPDSADVAKDAMPFLSAGVMMNSAFLDGLSVDAAKTKAIEYLEQLALGRRKINYRLRDWGVSRQRYWGCPIPIIHCPNCGTIPVSERDLPISLPEDIEFNSTGNPLEQHPSWKYVACPSCGEDALRETDTLDTFFESSWYFLRYCSPHADVPFQKKDVEYWMPVDNYIGGVEHAVMHLLYARFFIKALKKIGYLDIDEPFSSLLTQGMINHETYKDQDGNWLYPEEVTKTSQGAVHKVTGADVNVGRVEKMSKSKKNVVEPEQILEKYGADAVRLFLLSDSPPDRDLEWNDTGAEGCYKYLTKIDRMLKEFVAREKGQFPTSSTQDGVLIKATHSVIKNVANDIQNYGLNKVVAHLRGFTNTLQVAMHNASFHALQQGFETLLLLLHPMAPHITEELWQSLSAAQTTSQYPSLSVVPWPQYDPNLLQEEEVTIAVQVNGKLRTTTNILKDVHESVVQERVLNIPAIIGFLSDKTVKKVIYIPNKTINIVCS